MQPLSPAVRLSSDPRSLYPMPNHLLRRRLPSTFRVASTGGMALWLAGCAASPPQSPPPAQHPVSAPLKTIMMTVDEIQMAERHAYSDGFAAGQDYERQHCTVKPAPNTSMPPPPTPDLPNTKTSGGGTANTGAANTGASNATEQEGKTQAPPATPSKPNKSKPDTSAVLQSLPPFASVYSTSGPAQKLSP